MPKLFDNIVLLVDCKTSWSSTGITTTMPRGSHGVLVDQYTTDPRIWIIECPVPTTTEVVLVDADETCFAICEGEPKG